MKTQAFALSYSTCNVDADVGVIIPAAGSSTRMGGQDKLFALLENRPVLAHTLSAFEQHPRVRSIVVVTKKESVLDVQQLVFQHGFTKVCDIIAGGDTRAASVRLGFEQLKPSGLKTVLIHDGARPLVSKTVISRVIAGAEEFSAAAAAVSLKDAVKQIGPLGKIEKNVDRASLCAMQTPQGFAAANYARALQLAGSQDFVDDCAVMENAGYSVYTVPGDYKNIKITTPEDLIIAAAFLKEDEKCE